jgi:chorismate mutase
MDDLTQDYLEAIEQEIAAVDQELQDLFEVRCKLFEQREQVLAEHNSDDKRASNP